MGAHGYACHDMTSNPLNALPDGSLRHRYRCCGRLTKDVLPPQKPRYSSRVKAWPIPPGHPRLVASDRECFEWYDSSNVTGGGCQARGLYTDMVCVKRVAL